MITKITGLLVLIGIIFGAYFKIDTTYVRAESIKEVMQSIQKTNDKVDLEIILLKLELYQKQIDDLEVRCEHSCPLKDRQDLAKLKEKKEGLNKKMESLEVK